MEKDKKLRKGMKVEARLEEPGFEGFWYDAEILDISRDQDIAYVQYDTLMSEDYDKLKAYVKYRNLRPRQPDKGNQSLKPYDAVQAFHNGGWVEGRIKEAGSSAMISDKFVVCLSTTGEELEIQAYNLRRSADWLGGGRWAWADDTLLCGNSEMAFLRGTEVEVRRSFGGWYKAKIMYAGENSFFVEYCQLKSDDGIKLLMENVACENIRPVPPRLSIKDLTLLDKVDAWYLDGWQEGVITSFVSCLNYLVAFPKMEPSPLEFSPSDLRRHLEWINGDWVKASEDEHSTHHATRESNKGRGRSISHVSFQVPPPSHIHEVRLSQSLSLMIVDSALRQSLGHIEKLLSAKHLQDTQSFTQINFKIASLEQKVMQIAAALTQIEDSLAALRVDMSHPNNPPTI